MLHHAGSEEGNHIRAGWPTFFGIPLVNSLRDVVDADVVFLGIPFDMGTNDRPGSRFGPRIIRDSSMRFAEIGLDGWYDMEEDRHLLKGVRMVDAGDINIRTVGFEENFQKITETVRSARATGALPVLVGGDHALSYPIVRGFADGGPLQVVQFDAHMDYTDDWQGQRFSHDNQMRRISELPGMGLICQLGLHSLFERMEPVDAARERGNVLVTAKKMIDDEPAAVINRLPLTDAPCYVTLDIDVLSPSLIAGTGFPEPGGLNYYQLKEALIALARRTRIVGFDLVEVAPWFDGPGGVTSRVAARLLLDFLGAIFERRTE